LAAKPQTAAAFTADMRTDLDKRLMNISGIFIYIGPGSAHSACDIVEFPFGEEAEIGPCISNFRLSPKTALVGTGLRDLKYCLEREVASMMMGSSRSAAPICADHYSTTKQWKNCDLVSSRRSPV